MTPRFQFGRLATAVASLLLAAGPLAAAGEPFRPAERRLPAVDLSSLDPRPAAATAPALRAYRPNSLNGLAPSPVSIGFFRGHLAPKLDRQFGRMASYGALPTEGGALGEFALFEAVTDEARHHASHGLRRAVRDWALETSPLGEVAARFADGASARLGSGRTRGTTSIGIQVAHGLPVVELRHRLGHGVVRVGLAGYGALRLDVAHTRSARTRVAAEWDFGDDELRVGCRFGF